MSVITIAKNQIVNERQLILIMLRSDFELHHIITVTKHDKTGQNLLGFRNIFHVIDVIECFQASRYSCKRTFDYCNNWFLIFS